MGSHPDVFDKSRVVRIGSDVAGTRPGPHGLVDGVRQEPGHTP